MSRKRRDSRSIGSIVRKIGKLALVCLGLSDLVFLLQARPQAREQDGRYPKVGKALLGPPQTGVYAIVYYGQILRTAATQPVTKQDLLGYVMVHELGHLIGLRHSRDGVMNCEWKAREMALMAMRRLYFSASERHEMQFKIATRLMPKASLK